MTTHRKAILVALASFEAPADASDLVVRAWTMYPDKFGLRGYEAEYPHAVAVRSKLDGAEGLIARGFVAKLADGRLAITKAGKKYARGE